MQVARPMNEHAHITNEHDFSDVCLSDQLIWHIVPYKKVTAESQWKHGSATISLLM